LCRGTGLAVPGIVNAISTYETALTRRRYDRIAPIYDALEWAMELRFAGWRRALWSRVPGGRVLEVGVGTGKNLRYHPPGSAVTAIELSTGMLARGQRRAERLGQPPNWRSGMFSGWTSPTTASTR